LTLGIVRGLKAAPQVTGVLHMRVEEVRLTARKQVSDPRVHSKIALAELTGVGNIFTELVIPGSKGDGKRKRKRKRGKRAVVGLADDLRSGIGSFQRTS
jgi:hypothetical protein